MRLLECHVPAIDCRMNRRISADFSHLRVEDEYSGCLGLRPHPHVLSVGVHDVLTFRADHRCQRLIELEFEWAHWAVSFCIDKVAARFAIVLHHTQNVTVRGQANRHPVQGRLKCPTDSRSAPNGARAPVGTSRDQNLENLRNHGDLYFNDLLFLYNFVDWYLQQDHPTCMHTRYI